MKAQNPIAGIVPNPQPIAPPTTITGCMEDIAEGYTITADNWYWSETIDVIIQDTFKDTITDTATGRIRQFNWRPSTDIYYRLKAVDDAKSAPEKATADRKAQDYFNQLINHVNGGGHPLVIPINTGGHWVLAILKKGDDNKVKLYYVDPLGHDIADKHKKLFINAGIEGAGIIHSTAVLQNEDPKRDCGPYVLEAALLVANKLISQEQLTQNELNAEVAKIGAVGRTAGDLRQKHAAGIFVLAQKEPRMKEATAIIHQYSERELETLRGYLKSGDFDKCNSTLERNTDWLTSSKLAEGWYQHKTPTGEVIVTEESVSGKKKFIIADGKDATIRVPVLKEDGTILKNNNIIQYDILIYEKGKLSGIFLCDRAGAKSQLDPEWLKTQRSENINSASFIDGNEKRKEAPNRSAPSALPKPAAQKPQFHHPLYSLFSVIGKGLSIALGGRVRVGPQAQYPSLRVVKSITLGLGKGLNFIFGREGVIAFITPKVIQITAYSFNIMKDRVIPAVRTISVGSFNLAKNILVPALGKVVQKAIRYSALTALTALLIPYRFTAKCFKGEFKSAFKYAFGCFRAPNRRAIRGLPIVAPRIQQFNNPFAEARHVVALIEQRAGCHRQGGLRR